MAWTPQTLPAHWQSTRDAWDMFHAIGSVVAAIAWIALVTPLLRKAAVTH